MKDHAHQFSLGKMAKVLRVSRSGYYSFFRRELCSRAKKDRDLTEKIRKIYKDHREVYGSPRIHAALKKAGERCSRKRVAKLMKKEGIRAKMIKRWKTTTKSSKDTTRIAPNHLDQKFNVAAPNQTWASDISYVATEEGWLYLSVVIDLFSRKVVGLSTGSRLQTQLVLKAMNQALRHQDFSKEGMHHSDRGSQYTSDGFKKLTEANGIRLSMSGKGRCYDNAVVESFFHTLKTEHVSFERYRTREEATNSIFEYIEVFYNRQRSHSTLGYTSPVEYEKQWYAKNTSS